MGADPPDHARRNRGRTTARSTSTCGEWIRLFRARDFEIEALLELRAPEGGAAGRLTFVTPE